MDREIEELKQLVRRNIELSHETNKLVHSMHRQARWGAIWHALKLIVVVLLAGGIYIYLSPYIAQIRQMYENIIHVIPGH